MPRCRVVVPGLERLQLSDGDFIDVKRLLNAGEYVDLLTDIADRKKFAKILQYVIGWSLVGLNGQPLPYSLELPENVRQDTIAAQDPGTIREMITAIDRHEAAQERARAEKKRTPPGEPASSATSTSPDAAAGDMNGSTP